MERFVTKRTVVASRISSSLYQLSLPGIIPKPAIPASIIPVGYKMRRRYSLVHLIMKVVGIATNQILPIDISRDQSAR